MLDPEGRHLLLDALRPPPGHVLDLAVGTTYTLDLNALLTVPVAFAMFDREAADGSPRADPIATLHALRRHAGRITLFCQAGDIAVPRDYRSLVVYLEQSVVQVVPPRRDALFHPKVWFIRYRQPDTGAMAFRLLCMSRNLTFDRSWDTVLRLEGEPSDTVRHPELRTFVESLPAMAAAVRPIDVGRQSTIDGLAAELERVQWLGPGDLEVVRFWPLGHDRTRAWPFGEPTQRIFAASPFVTVGALQRLTNGVGRSILLARPEAFDLLGGNATAHLRERLVLSADTREPFEEDGAGEGAVPTTPALSGLHAKLVVADVPDGGRVWTGSANLTDAAFGGNVEFVTELRGTRSACGVDAIIGDHGSRMGLRKLVEPYEPATAEGRDLTLEEVMEQRLADLRQMLGRLRYVADCRKHEAGGFELTLTGAPGDGGAMDGAEMEGLAATVRPITLGEGASTAVALAPSGLNVRWRVSYEAVTPFFAFHLRPLEAGGAAALESTFLINAELLGAPEDRAENVMVGLLRNKADLIRFLLLLLGNIDEAMAAMTGGDDSVWSGSGSWAGRSASEALLEPLVRAYARDRGRLHEIALLMDELAKTETGSSILPEGWAAVWGPIQEALGWEADE